MPLTAHPHSNGQTKGSNDSRYNAYYGIFAERFLTPSSVFNLSSFVAGVDTDASLSSSMAGADTDGQVIRMASDGMSASSSFVVILHSNGGSLETMAFAASCSELDR